MTRKEQYKANKQAKVGEVIVCPICGKKFVKKQYSQAFCGADCKDKFWNAKKDRHRPGYYRAYNAKHPERVAFIMEKTMIQRAGCTGLSWADQEEREAIHEYCTNPDFRKYVDDGALDMGGGWDSHECSITMAQQLRNFEGDFE